MRFEFKYKGITLIGYTCGDTTEKTESLNNRNMVSVLEQIQEIQDKYNLDMRDFELEEDEGYIYLKYPVKMSDKEVEESIEKAKKAAIIDYEHQLNKSAALLRKAGYTVEEKK